MKNPATITEIGSDSFIYAQYIKPITPKAATSRKFWKVKERSFPVENAKNLEVKKGDYIEVSVETGVTIRAAFLVFMMPLIFFALLYGLGGVLFKSEVPQVILGLAGLGGGLVFPAFVNLLKKKKDYPQLERLLSREEAQEIVSCETDCESCGGCG